MPTHPQREPTQGPNPGPNPDSAVPGADVAPAMATSTPLPKPASVSRRRVLASTALVTGLASPSAADDSESAVSQVMRHPASSRTGMTFIKQTAISDYRRSFAEHGGRLSNDIRKLLADSSLGSDVPFSVVIIGSGYGASICAARLSKRLRPGQRLAILERGREWVPGTFPDTFRDIRQHTRQRLTGPNKGDTIHPLGLFQLKMSDEINTLSASGLGGTSLINANVAIKPDPETLRQTCWPISLSRPQELDAYYDRAARMLNLARTPVDLTPKVRSRRLAAEKLNPRPGFFDLSPVTVNYDNRYLNGNSQNPFGVFQRPCIQCGDCITGCNVGAKNTLTTNYLPLAKRHGAEIYTQIEVTAIEPTDFGYRVHVVYNDDASGKLQSSCFSISAKMVIVAAGSPSSAEILLQSREFGLCTSPALGQRWSFNGDTIGFVIKPESQGPIGGFGAYEDGCRPVGATVQTSLFYSHRPQLRHRIVIQEAAIPRAMTPLFSLLLQDRELCQSMVMLGMGHDGNMGRLIWKQGRWQVAWPGLRDSRYRNMIFKDFELLAQAHGGWYKRLRVFGDTLVSVHPLGACAMSDDPLQGVVDDRGQVYDFRGAAERESGVYPGLFVADGSIVPTALGVNPLMTICALSERIAEKITLDPQWSSLFA